MFVSFFRDQGEEPPTGRTPAPNAGTIASATGLDRRGGRTTATTLQVTLHPCRPRRTKVPQSRSFKTAVKHLNLQLPSASE